MLVNQPRIRHYKKNPPRGGSRGGITIAVVGAGLTGFTVLEPTACRKDQIPQRHRARLLGKGKTKVPG
jgi:hypothetical protein